VLVNTKGLIRVVVPAGDDLMGDAHEMRAILDVSSVVGAMVPAVVSIVDGGFEALFPGALRTDRFDWHFDVSSHVTVGGNMVPRIGLSFRGREPNEGTTGQYAMSADSLGFGGRDLQNISTRTEPAELVMTALAAFVQKSGYSGLSDCLIDLRNEVNQLVAKRRAQARPE
jgi:hypothetical protein